MRTRHALTDFISDESGQDLIEYALIAGLIGLAAVATMTGLSTKIRQAFNSIGNSLTNEI
jgi:pilus assembly protein Flp/PilA